MPAIPHGDGRPCLLTFSQHSSVDALLEATVLTPASCRLVDFAVFGAVASVLHVLLHAPSKETLPENGGVFRHL